MAIFYKITDNTTGTTFYDVTEAYVESNVSDYDIINKFEARMPNLAGRHSTDFTVGDEIIVYSDTSNPPTTKIFDGILENVDFEGEGLDEMITISGRDFTTRLIDYTVDPSVFTNQEVSTIVTNLFNTLNPTNLTANNIQVTNTTLQRIFFSEVTFYDALKRLSEYSEYRFYVDVNKNLHFEQKSSISSGFTLDKTNTWKARIKITRDGVFNNIKVYGGKAVSQVPQEVFTPSGGSLFTLSRKPSLTGMTVSYQGITKRGGIFQNLQSPGSEQYQINQQGRAIIFTSGTIPGNNLPGSNVGSVVVNYFADVPIVKYGQNRSSISQFGLISKIINDKAITDPTAAQDRLLNELKLSANPPYRIELYLKDIANLTPGNTIIVNQPDFNINSVTYDIVGLKWEFNKSNVHSGKVLTAFCNKRVQEITDPFIKISAALKDIRAGDAALGDLITRYEFGTGSYAIAGSYWEAKTRTTGSSFILGQSARGGGQLDSPFCQLGNTGDQIFLLDASLFFSGRGIIGSATGSFIANPIHVLGDYRSAFTIQVSGTV